MALLAVGLLVGARLMGAARAAPQGTQSAELALRDRLAEAEGWGRQADRAAALDEAAALAAFELHQPQRAITLLRERLQRFPGAPGRAAALAQLAGLYATALRDPARAAATFEESARSDLRGAGPRWLAAAEAWEEAGSRAHAIEALEAAEADPACAFAAAVSLGRLLLDLARNIGDLTVVIRGEGIADTATPESRGARIVDLMGAPPKVEQAPPPEPIVVIRQVRKTETPIEEIRGGRIIQNKSLD